MANLPFDIPKLLLTKIYIYLCCPGPRHVVLLRSLSGMTSWFSIFQHGGSLSPSSPCTSPRILKVPPLYTLPSHWLSAFVDKSEPTVGRVPQCLMCGDTANKFLRNMISIIQAALNQSHNISPFLSIKKVFSLRYILNIIVTVM